MNNNITFTLFKQAVQRKAIAIVDNTHAGQTADETGYIHKYYISNRKQVLSTAIATCACTMLEKFRGSELHSA